MYSVVTAAAPLFSVLKVEWIKTELLTITNTCAVFVIPKDLLKKWVLKCVKYIVLMPAAIAL